MAQAKKNPAKASKPKPATTKPAPAPETVSEPIPEVSRPAVRYLAIVAAVAGVFVVLFGGYNLIYAGKIMPGVSIAGTYVGGLTQQEASDAVNQDLQAYEKDTLLVTAGDASVSVNLASLKLHYDAAQAAHLAASYGRNGSLTHRLAEQLRSLFGRPTNIVAYSYSDEALAPYVQHLVDKVDTPVQDAGLTFAGQTSSVVPSQPGDRVDIGRLTTAIEDNLGTLSNADITIPVYQQQPLISTQDLNAAKDQGAVYLSAAVTLKRADQAYVVDQKTLASWLTVGRSVQPDFSVTHQVTDLLTQPRPVQVVMDKKKVAAYVASLADKIDQPGQNAVLAMDSGHLTVVKPSQAGYSLNQDKAVNDIMAAAASARQRNLVLDVQVTQPQVTETNLASLGITEQISEGETYFPGSPADRLINVRAGANKFNDVLIAPGDTFSFGALLGAVDASTGYVPELVIVGNHEEYQYGGGLCQVSSTAFRAALAAGLPITERVNHSFAISYYTWPYNVPGVDATIYYPQVDMKFLNDTGHYILIQTTMKGVDLKFDFYGTKTKTGEIRGPYFIDPPNGAGWNTTVPSKTVFYRDVKDLSGNVIKTDTFYTSYQSSKNFPIQKQFN